MSTYLKFIVIAALFISTGAASALADSQASSSSTTSRTTVKQSSTKKAEASTEKSSAASSSQAASSSTAASESSTQASEVPAVASSSEEVNAQAAPTVESTEANDRPAPTVNEAETTNETTAPAEENQNAANPAPASMQADQLMVNGQLISYANAGQGNGQAIIDANPNVVATWGGSAVQSGNDGVNTHFIGHNPGIFNVLFSVGTGATIEVSDGSNNVTSYTVSQIVTVDDSGIAEDGTDYWDQITGTGGGERITLQTCINDDYNLIVFANK